MSILYEYDSTRGDTFNPERLGWKLRGGVLTRVKPQAMFALTQQRSVQLAEHCFVLFEQAPYDYASQYAMDVLVLSPDEYNDYTRESCFRQRLSESSTPSSLLVGGTSNDE